MSTDSYYATTTYHPELIPEQAPSISRTWIRKFSKARLPWGNTQEVTPSDFLWREDPKHMRALEKEEQERHTGTYNPAQFEHLDFHYIHDQEKLRFAQLPSGSRALMISYALGKGGFLMMFILMIPVCILFASDTNKFWPSLIDIFTGTFLIICVPPLVLWGGASMILYKFPELWARPSRGPEWELNRRTGMVTVFDYDNNGEYKKNGTIGEIVRPFYEFDAYVSTHPDRQGLPISFLYLHHRYEDIKFSLAGLLPMDRFAEPHYALWDYLQNFMDTSRPLPDDPFHEPLRDLDPTSAEHDRQSNRPPRYWRDMDDETYKLKVAEMEKRIATIDTLRRHNLMANYCEYVD